MPELLIELHLEPGQILTYYQGLSQIVRARAVTGQTVVFPASSLRQHVSKDGIHGRFRLEFDDNHKFIRLVPVDRG